jgi:hypothetical protein
MSKTITKVSILAIMYAILGLFLYILLTFCFTEDNSLKIEKFSQIFQGISTLKNLDFKEGFCSSELKFSRKELKIIEKYNFSEKCEVRSQDFIERKNFKFKVRCEQKVFPSFYFEEDKNSYFSKHSGNLEIIWDSLQGNKTGSEFVFINCGKDSVYSFVSHKAKKKASERVTMIKQSFGRPQKSLNVVFISLDSFSRHLFNTSFPKTHSLLNSFSSDSPFSFYDFKKASIPDMSRSNIFMQTFFGIEARDHLKVINQLSTTEQKLKDFLYHTQKKSIWSNFFYNGFSTLVLSNNERFEKLAGNQILADYFLHEFWKIGETIYEHDSKNSSCYGNRTLTSFAFDYSLDFFKNFKENKFLLLELARNTSKPHNYQNFDQEFQFFLENLLKSYEKLDKNLVILIVSNKGEDFQEFEWNPKGFYLNSNPATFLITSKNFISDYSDDAILKHNTKNLVTKRDLFITLKNLAGYPNSNQETEFIKQGRFFVQAGNIFTRKLQQMTCEALKTQDICPCSGFQSVDLKNGRDNFFLYQIQEFAKDLVKDAKMKDCLENQNFQIKSAKKFNMRQKETGEIIIYDVDCSGNDEEKCRILAGVKIDKKGDLSVYSKVVSFERIDFRIVIVSVEGEKECLEVEAFQAELE